MSSWLGWKLRKKIRTGSRVCNQINKGQTVTVCPSCIPCKGERN